MKKERFFLASGFMILTFGILVACLYKGTLSWPSMSGWDVYTHLAVSNLIVENNGTRNFYHLGPSMLIPYPYLFHVMVASISLAIEVNPYLVFWIAPFLTIPFYGILNFGVSNLLTGQRLLSFVSAIITVTICGGAFFLGPHYFFPSTISLLLFPMLLAVMLDFKIRSSLSKIIIFCLLAFFYAFYHYAWITFPIFLYFIAAQVSTKSLLQRRIKIFFAFSILITIALSWFGAYLLSPNIYSLSQKIQMITAAYPDILWFLFLLGAFLIIRMKGPLPDKQNNLLVVAIYASTLIAIYFQPPYLTGRVEIFFRPFFSIIASFPFILVHSIFSAQKTLEISFLGRRFRTKFLSHVPFFLLLIFLVSSSIQPYLSYANKVPYLSNISQDEYDAAKWLAQNSLPNSYILTDPSTGRVLRGLIVKNASTSFIINEQAPSHRVEQWPELTTQIYNFFKEDNPLKINNSLSKLPKKPDYITITTRTSSWINSGVNTTVAAPRDEISFFPGIEKFSTPLFVLQKSWRTVKIYRLSEAQTIQIWVSNFQSQNWTWRLSGEYENYSVQTDTGILRMTVTASNEESTWTGLTHSITGFPYSIYINIKYRINIPCDSLRIILWRSVEDPIVYHLEQMQEWNEETFFLQREEAETIYNIGLMMRTLDNLHHIVEVEYIEFLGFN